MNATICGAWVVLTYWKGRDAVGWQGKKVYNAFRVPPLPPQYCPLSSDGSLGLLALAVNQPKAGLSRELFFPQLVRLRLRLGLLMVVWNRPGSQDTD